MKRPTADEREPQVIEHAQAIDRDQFALVPQYAEARKMLMTVQSIDEAKGVRNKADALRVYAIKAKDRELEAAAAEIRLRAERKAGELLIAMSRNGVRRPAHGNNRKFESHDPTQTMPTLKDLGVSKYEASDWQKIAMLPEPEFESRLDRIRMMLGIKPVTTNRFLKTAFSSHSNEWLTPPHIIEAVLAVMGEIDLDPCAESPQTQMADWNVPASVHFTRREDGLQQPWTGRVYMNPPYGGLVGNFCDNLVETWEGGEGPVTEAIALVAARTDTQWFQRLAKAGSVWCAVTGRLNFSGHEDPAPFPSAIFYMGRRQARFVEVFSKLGPVFGVI
jgi:hypothetical protein